MNGRGLGLLMLAVWGSWLSGAQAVLASAGWLGAFVPDLGLTLLVVLALRVSKKLVFPAALSLAFARCAYTIDPPVAVLSGFLAAGLFVRGLRAGVDLSGPFGRALVCLLVALPYTAWLALARQARRRTAVSELPEGQELLELVAAGLPTAVASALVALIVGALLVRLPGISVLEKRSAFG